MAVHGRAETNFGASLYGVVCGGRGGGPRGVRRQRAKDDVADIVGALGLEGCAGIESFWPRALLRSLWSRVAKAAPQLRAGRWYAVGLAAPSEHCITTAPAPVHEVDFLPETFG